MRKHYTNKLHLESQTESKGSQKENIYLIPKVIVSSLDLR